MDIATLESNLKAGKLNSIYLLYGKERFLLDNCVKKINKLFGEIINGINYIQIDNNNITSDPTIAGYEVTIAKDGDHYSISCSAGYIGWTGSGNNITSSSSVNSDNYRWDISVESGIMNVQLDEGANRYLHFNNSANPKRFTCYKASSRQMEVSLYKLAE